VCCVSSLKQGSLFVGADFSVTQRGEDVGEGSSHGWTILGEEEKGTVRVQKRRVTVDAGNEAWLTWQSVGPHCDIKSPITVDAHGWRLVRCPGRLRDVANTCSLSFVLDGRREIRPHSEGVLPQAEQGSPLVCNFASQVLVLYPRSLSAVSHVHIIASFVEYRLPYIVHCVEREGP
jgi:hypothetical protein